MQQVQVTLISWQPHGSSSTLGEKWWKDKRNHAASDLYLATTPILLFFLLSSESSFSYSRKMILINWANYYNIDDDHDDNDDNDKDNDDDDDKDHYDDDTNASDDDHDDGDANDDDLDDDAECSGASRGDLCVPNVAQSGEEVCQK